jgi:hypothetical protein
MSELRASVIVPVRALLYLVVAPLARTAQLLGWWQGWRLA